MIKRLHRIKLLLFFSLCVVVFSTTSAFSYPSDNVGDDRPMIVRYYPNPATTFISFEFEKEATKQYSLQIYNFLGRTMLETRIQTVKATIDLTEFNRGIYFYQLRDKSGHIVESGKFQVIK